MFITNEANRSPIGSLFLTPAEKYWTTAELSLSRMWFLLTFSQRDKPSDPKSFATNRTMLLSDVEDLAGFIELGEQPGFRFVSAYVVVPPMVAESVDWKLERLKAVWSARDDSAPGGVVDVFEATSGARYTDGLHELPLHQLQDLEIRIRVPEPPGH